MTRSPLSRLVLAGLLTGVVDGLFAFVLGDIYYGSIFRIWEMVAATVVGPSALEGGPRSAGLGLLIHFGVAFGWSAVFLALYEALPAIRRRLRTRGGVLLAAAVYGPLIWMMMSLVVIPLLTQRLPSINGRWWIQFFGHVPFVGLPIVSQIARGGGGRD